MEKHIATSEQQAYRREDQTYKAKLLKPILPIIIVLLIFLGVFTGWLPLTHPQTKQKNTVTSNPSGIKKDPAKAKALLFQFVKDTVKPAMIPPTVSVTQKTIFSERTAVFVMPLNANMSANIVYGENSDIPVSYYISTSQIKPTNEQVAVPQANSLLSLYFINPNTIVDCQTKEAETFCEKYQSTSVGTKGYGIMISKLNEQKTVATVYTCFTPKESESYTGEGKCLHLLP